MNFSSFFVVLLLALCCFIDHADAKISLQIELTSAVTEYGYAQITWSVGGNHTILPGKDWVSMWWEPFQATYVEFLNVTAQQGMVQFAVLNARHGYYARYYSGGSIFAQTEAVYPEGSYPNQLRVSLPDNDPSHVAISWTSNRTNENTALWYGQNPSQLTKVTSFSVSTYTHSELNARVKLPPIPIRTTSFKDIESRNLRCHTDTCWNDYTSSQLYVDPGQFISVLLTALKPATTYYYRVGEEGGYQSKIRSFKTRVPPGPDVPVSVLYVADAGIGEAWGGKAGGATHNDIPINGADKVWRAIMNDPLLENDDLMIFNGDISYARGWPYIWEVFHNQTSRGIMDQRPMLVSFGNHEFDFGQNPFTLTNGGDSGGEAGIVTMQRFGLSSLTEPWYYRTYGPLFIISLSSEHSVKQQIHWLENVALPRFNRSMTPWLIVFIHRPVFTSNFMGNIFLHIEFLKYADLFTKYGVDLVLTGHDHYYERLCAISSAECDTWGFRDVWNEFIHSTVSTSQSPAACFADGGKPALDVLQCRAGCASTTNCTGVVWNGKALHCSLLTCPLSSYVTSWDPDTSVFHLNKIPGKAPVYIIDGSAGAEFSPLWTLPSPLTKYKEFRKWGYSRFIANATQLQWIHYHTDNSVADEVKIER